MPCLRHRNSAVKTHIASQEPQEASRSVMASAEGPVGELLLPCEEWEPKLGPVHLVSVSAATTLMQTTLRSPLNLEVKIQLKISRL